MSFIDMVCVPCNRRQRSLTWKNVEFASLQLSSQGSAQHTEKYSEDAKQFESALASEACQFMGHSHLSK